MREHTSAIVNLTMSCTICILHNNYYEYVFRYNFILFLGTPIKPTVTVLPSQLIELKVNNFMLRMKCLPYDSNFNYKWERKNRQLPLNALNITSEQLRITNLKPGDSGEYRCIMSNSTGQIASDYSLVTVKGLI